MAPSGLALHFSVARFGIESHRARTRWLLDMGVDPNAVCTVLRQKDNSGFAEIEYLGNTDDGFRRLRNHLFALEEVSQLGLRADYKCTALGMFFFHFTKTMVLTNRTRRSVGVGTDPELHVPDVRRKTRSTRST